ncbi:extracellular solute-binding protein [Streptomyces armeniacus]|uniref:Extracellular solute-binding protein n=1 Tax=Streptomyces armeniacus TaxID=83291 RepID=A0A345XT62_9ACTN|nr:extracellular solute-binding protein [Streptomyces armeniacus]AXK34828.1 extracellular solute-binding protein [Streptomyces armeniacus]
MRDRPPLPGTPLGGPPPAGSRTAPTRRALLRAAGALGATAAAGGALSGCGTAIGQGFTGDSGPASLLNFWNPFTGGDGARMVEMERDYRKRHPDVDLKATTFVWGDPYYTKLTLATLGDRPPQVAITHLSKIPTLAGAGLLREIGDDELAAHGMGADRFDQRAWRKAHYDGALRAIPLDTHPFVLYVRTDIAKKAGLTGSGGELADVDGPEQFLDALRAAKEVTGAWGCSIASTKDPSTCFRLFWSLYRQLGGRLLADEGAKVVIDMEAAGEAFAYIRRLTQEKLVPTGVDSPGAITLLTSGQAGFLMDGVWQILAVQDSKVAFDMLPFPRIFRDAPYACHADSHGLVLPKAPSPDAQRADRSLEFIRSLLDASDAWAGGGHIPAWLPTQESEAYRKLEPQAHYAAASDGAAYDPGAWYSGAGSSLHNRLGDVCASVLGGRTTPTRGAARIREELRELAATPSPL